MPASTRAGRAGDLRAFTTLYAALGAGVGTLLPYLVLYLTDRGLSTSQAGLVLGLMAAVGVLAVPAWGLLADRVTGPVLAMRASCLLAALASLALLAAGRSTWAVVTCAALLAAARAPGEALADTMALAALGPGGAHRYGSIRLWASLGFAVTVATWGLVLEHTGLGLVLLAYPVALLVEAACTARVPATARSAAPSVGGVRLVTGRFAVLLLGTFLFGTAMGATITVLPLRLTDTGGGLVAVGTAGVLGALAEVPLMRSSTRLRARLGASRVLLAGGGLFGVAVLLYGVVAAPTPIVLASALRGAGYGLVYVALVVAVGGLLPAERQASGQALLQTTLMGAAPILGSSAGGVTYEHAGPGVLFTAAAVLSLLGALVCRAGLPAGDRR